jgi:hypothetical protein
VLFSCFVLQTLNGVNFTTFQKTEAASIAAFCATVAQAINSPGITSSNINVNSVSPVGSTARRQLSHLEADDRLQPQPVQRMLASGDGVSIQYTVSTTNAVGFSSGAAAYSQFTANLNSAISDGTFTAALKSNAQSAGAAGLASSAVTASAVTTIALIPTAAPTYPPSLAPTMSMCGSDTVAVGFGVGAGLGGLGLLGVCMYVVYKRNSDGGEKYKATKKKGKGMSKKKTRRTVDEREDEDENEKQSEGELSNSSSISTKLSTFKTPKLQPRGASTKQQTQSKQSQSKRKQGSEQQTASGYGRVLINGPQLLGSPESDSVRTDDVKLVEYSTTNIKTKGPSRRVQILSNESVSDADDEERIIGGGRLVGQVVIPINEHLLGDNDDVGADADNDDEGNNDENTIPPSPFKRFRPHLYKPEFTQSTPNGNEQQPHVRTPRQPRQPEVQQQVQPGRYLVSRRSPVFRYMQYLCNSRGGSWDRAEANTDNSNTVRKQQLRVAKSPSFYVSSMSLLSLSADAGGNSKLPNCRVTGFRLVDVEMIVPHKHSVITFESRHNQVKAAISAASPPSKGAGKKAGIGSPGSMSSKTSTSSVNGGGGGGGGGASGSSFNRQQQRVLDLLKAQYHSRGVHTPTRTANTLYTFVGPRREHLDYVCKHGMVAVKGLHHLQRAHSPRTHGEESGGHSPGDNVNEMDMGSGYFGLGCYTTLNVEYALRTARGDFDALDRPRSRPVDRRYAVIMMAATVNSVYPVTPATDYVQGSAGPLSSPVGGLLQALGIRDQAVPVGYCNFLGKPVKAGYDAHVVCVNERAHKAVARDDSDEDEDSEDEDASEDESEEHKGKGGRRNRTARMDKKKASKAKKAATLNCGLQAVEADRCQYVEVIVASEVQLLPVAVLWFEES